MLWLTAAREGLDDDHAATAAGTWTQQHAGLVDCCFGRLGFFQARRHREQLAGACNIGRAVAIGKQSVVADAVEAVRQDVDEKAAERQTCWCSWRFGSAYPHMLWLPAFEARGIDVPPKKKRVDHREETEHMTVSALSGGRHSSHECSRCSARIGHPARSIASS